MSKCKCVLADRVCPETADGSKEAYCPLWVDAIPEVVKDGSGRLVSEELYRGCFLRRLPLYLIGVTASAGQAAASADVGRDASLAVARALDGGVGPLLQVVSALALPAIKAAELPPAVEESS